jgi:glycosyltransferase involved in cell wall biosynthesis
MAAGLPAIITDMGGNSDIIRSEDDGGLLVPYDEPETMARAMLRFMEEPGLLERCRDNARRSIQTKFHVNTMCDATFAVYQAALR